MMPPQEHLQHVRLRPALDQNPSPISRRASATFNPGRQRHLYAAPRRPSFRQRARLRFFERLPHCHRQPGWCVPTSANAEDVHDRKGSATCRNHRSSSRGLDRNSHPHSDSSPKHDGREARSPIYSPFASHAGDRGAPSGASSREHRAAGSVRFFSIRPCVHTHAPRMMSDGLRPCASFRTARVHTFAVTWYSDTPIPVPSVLRPRVPDHFRIIDRIIPTQQPRRNTGPTAIRGSRRALSSP